MSSLLITVRVRVCVCVCVCTHPIMVTSKSYVSYLDMYAFANPGIVVTRSHTLCDSKKRRRRR